MESSSCRTIGSVKAAKKPVFTRDEVKLKQRVALVPTGAGTKTDGDSHERSYCQASATRIGNDCCRSRHAHFDGHLSVLIMDQHIPGE
jgi:hypothetical protein